MILLSRRSIVFRLWLRLSFITMAVALFALGAYVTIDVQDNISAAEARAQLRADAVFAATSHLATSNATPAQSELDIAKSLDIAVVDVLDANGNVTRSLGSLSSNAASRAVDPTELARSIANGPSHNDVVFNAFGDYTMTQLQPGAMLDGGEYGAEYFYPLSAVSPSSGGALRIVATFPGVARESQILALRSLGLTAVIAGAMIFAMWILLNALVARPLRSYSDAAVRIARGEMVRM